MAKDRDRNRRERNRPSPQTTAATLDRRSVLLLGAPTLGAAAALALPRRAVPATARPQTDEDMQNNETGLTAHRRAYYDRARY